MFDWLHRIVLSRYTKSAVRYIIAIVIGALAGQDIPGLAELSEFLKEHSETLSGIVSVILAGLLGTWSVAKNKVNDNISPGTK